MRDRIAEQERATIHDPDRATEDYDTDHKHVIGPDMRHGDKTTEAHVVFTFETTQLQLV